MNDLTAALVVKRTPSADAEQVTAADHHHGGRGARASRAHSVAAQRSAPCHLIAFRTVLSLTPKRRPIAESLSPSW